MKGMKIYDFDCLEKPDRIVKLKGHEFTIPGDFPASLLLASTRYRELLDAEDNSAFDFITGHIYSYFKIKNKDLKKDDFESLLSIEIIPALLSAIMNDVSPEETKKVMEEAIGEIQKKTEDSEK